MASEISVGNFSGAFKLKPLVILIHSFRRKFIILGEVIGILIVIFTRLAVLFDFFNIIDGGEVIGILIVIFTRLAVLFDLFNFIDGGEVIGILIFTRLAVLFDLFNLTYLGKGVGVHKSWNQSLVKI